jgi:hypothetical protein
MFKDKYTDVTLRFGILTTLCLLEYYTEIEDFEECQKIIDSINMINSAYEINLPKNINEETIFIVKENYKKLGLLQNDPIEISKYCAKHIIDNNKQFLETYK